MYLIEAKQKSKFLFHIRDPIENATQNPAYGVTPNLVAMDNQRGSRTITLYPNKKRTIVYRLL